MSLRLASIVVGEPGAAWERAGFSVVDDTVHLGAVSVVCAGDGDASSRWILNGAGDLATVDGISVRPGSAAGPTAPHRNRVVDLDHIVLRSPDIDRTTATLEHLGLECRRVRDVPLGDTPMQQRFFRIPTGPPEAATSTILELVGPVTPTEGGPATIWGLACVVDDIDAATAELGSASSEPRAAVQPGRRIATVRTRDLGIDLTLALMTPRG